MSGERPHATVKIEHGWAWCVWPTVVHLEDIHLMVDGPRWQLDLRLPRGVVDIKLRKLASRRIETTSFKGVGAQVAFSIKRPYGASASEIEGYYRLSDDLPAPILDASPRPVPTPDQAWEFVLNGVETSVRQLLFNALQMQVEGHFAGVLDVQVAHRFGSQKFLLSIEEGIAHRLGTKLADGVQGQFDLVIDSYSPQQRQGREVLRMLSGAVALRANLADLGWVTNFRSNLPVDIRRGGGNFDCAVELDRGVLVAGSVARFKTSEVVVSRALRQSSLSVQAGAELRASSTNDGRLAVAGSLNQLRGRVGEAKKSSFTAEHLNFEANFASVDLVDGPGDRTFTSVKVPAFKLGNLRALSPLIDSVKLRGGNVTGHANARSSKPGRYKIDFAIDFNKLALTHNQIRLTTDGYVRSEGELQVDESKIELPLVRAKIHGLSLSSGRGATVGGWIEIQRASARYSRKLARLEVESHGRIENLRTILAHLRNGKDIFERRPNAGLGSRPVEYALKLIRTPNAVRIDVSKLAGGPIDARAAIVKSGDKLRTAVYLRRARIGITTTGGGSRDVKLAAGPEWFSEQQAWVHGLFQ